MSGLPVGCVLFIKLSTSRTTTENQDGNSHYPQTRAFKMSVHKPTRVTETSSTYYVPCVAVKTRSKLHFQSQLSCSVTSNRVTGVEKKGSTWRERGREMMWLTANTSHLSVWACMSSPIEQTTPKRDSHRVPRRRPPPPHGVLTSEYACPASR